MEYRFEHFTKDITAIYRSVQRIKHTEMTEFGLKGMHVMCLYFLSKHPQGLTAAQLQKLCQEDKAAISRSLATLKEKNLIAESQADGQKKYRSIITLTKEGKETALREGQMIEQALNAGGQGLSEEERKNFYSSLSLISENLKRYEKRIKEHKE